MFKETVCIFQKKKKNTLRLLKTEVLTTAWMNIPQSLYIIEVTNIDFPGGSDGKASAYNAGDPGSIHVQWVGKIS